MALPANINYGTVSGVFLRAKADGVDVDRNPDGDPIRGLKVTFTPSISPALVKNTTAVPPVTILIDPVVCTTDDDGVLCGPDGSPDVLLVASGDTDLDPSGWTWTVEIKQTSTFPRVSFAFVVGVDSVTDLSTVLPVPAGLGADLILWQQAVADTLAAKVAAQAAQAAAEAVPTTTDGLMTTIDANAASAYRVQADARQNATIDDAVTAGVAPKLDASVAATTYASALRVAPAPGRKVAFGGDSVTAGTGTSISNRRFSVVAPMLAGTRWFSRNPLQAGVAGNTSAQLLARLAADILSDAAVQHVHIQVGTNDAGAGVTPTVYSTNIKAIHALVQGSGRSMSIGLVPPRSSAAGTASSRQLETAYNEWISSWAGPAGVAVADTRTPLVDPATGYLYAAMTTDGIHPTDDGHLAIARAVATALSARIAKTPGSRIVNPDVNKFTNGTMTGGTASTAPTGWFKHPSSTGTAPVIGTVADASSTLTEGLWLQVDLNAAATSNVILLGPAITTSGAFAENDQIIAECQIQIEDVTGFKAAYLAGTANLSVKLINQSMVQLGGQAILENLGTENPGPARFAALTPSAAGATAVNVMVTLNAPAGVQARVRIGAVSFRNGTTEGAINIAS